MEVKNMVVFNLNNLKAFYFCREGAVWPWVHKLGMCEFGWEKIECHRMDNFVWSWNFHWLFVQVKGVSWDATLGGQNMEMRLVDHFAAQFKSQTGIDVYKHPKGMAKLKKQVKRTKEILSANTEAGISVESMVEDHDFR